MCHFQGSSKRVVNKDGEITQYSLFSFSFSSLFFFSVLVPESKSGACCCRFKLVLFTGLQLRAMTENRYISVLLEVFSSSFLS